MKKIVSLLGIIALMLTGFTACNKVSEKDTPSTGKHIIKVTPMMAETRTVLDEDGNTITVKWADSDIALDSEGNGMFHVWENGVKGLTEATLNQDKTIATITCAFDQNQSTNLVYSSCFAKTLDDNGNPIVLDFQNPGPSSFDPNADLLIGENITRNTQPDELLVNFSRPVAIVKMTLKGLEVGETVSSVFITSKSGKLSCAYNRAQGAFDFENGKEEIVVCPQNVTVGSDGTAPIYFVCAPVEDEILEIHVWTSKGGATSSDEYEYQKEFTKEISFPANTLTRFTANLTCCEVAPENPEPTVFFEETFNTNSSSGGNGATEGTVNFNTAGNTTIDSDPDNYTDNDGWTFSNAYTANKCIKLGGGKTLGSATTPGLNITKTTATLKFRAAAWNGSSENLTLKLSVSGSGTINPETVTLSKTAWTEYTTTITNGSADTKVTFEGYEANNSRFFLDNVSVEEERTVNPNVVNLEIADNTDINASETVATVAIRSNKSWTVTSAEESNTLLTAPIKVNGTAQTTSFTVNFATANTSTSEPKVVSLNVVAGAGEYAVTKTITVTQKTVPPTISIDPTSMTVEASATSATFTVTECNFDWNIVTIKVNGEEVAAGSPFSAVKDQNDPTKVNVSFPSNVVDGEDTSTRTIAVSVGNDARKVTCSISQNGHINQNENERIDVLTRELTGVSGTSYNDWSGKQFSGGSNAVYAGNSAGGNSSIQLRDTNPSGIVSTTSGGRIKKIVVTWNYQTVNDRAIDIYGSNTAYESAADLYDSNKQGTKLGSIQRGSTTLEVSGNYKFIGIRSSLGSLYLTEVRVIWNTTPPTLYDINVTASDQGTITVMSGNTAVTQAEDGDQISLTATGNDSGTPKYKFKEWVITGLTLEAGQNTTNPLTITMPANAITVNAIYEEDTATEKSVTYTVTSTSAVSVSGQAPNGASASYSSTFSTACQLTKNNSMTLTLSGYAGKKIKGLTLSMRSNSSGGSGFMYMATKNGSTETNFATIGNSESPIAFNKEAWNGAWSTSYVDISVPVTETTVANSEDVVIHIAATANSLYCQSFTLIYE